MRKVWFLTVMAAVFSTAPARAAIILEFFQGTSENDAVLSLTPFPAGGVPLQAGGPRQFVQVALHQTAPTTVISPTNGLAAFFLQGVYGPGAAGNYFVPATNNLPTGTTPVVNVADPATYTLLSSYRTGPGGNMSGGTAATATAFRFGGLDATPPPSPSVDVNGRIFLGTFALQAFPSAVGGSISIIFQDPRPNPGVIDNITDMGDNLDALLFNGNTYPLSI